MSNPLWPAGLPQNPFALDGAVYIPHENRNTESPSSGPQKVRPMFTAVYDRFTFSMELTRVEYQTLMSFMLDTLKEVRKFEWIDFRTGESCLYRFVRRPEAQYVAGDGELWLCRIELERMP